MVTISQKISQDLTDEYRNIACALTRNGYPATEDEVQKWDEDGCVPNNMLECFAQALDLSIPEMDRINQTSVKNRGEGFIEYHESFYQKGWFVYIWDANIGVYVCDRIERCREDAQYILGRRLQKM